MISASSDQSRPVTRRFSRRHVVAATVWAPPVILVIAPAPSFAASACSAAINPMPSSGTSGNGWVVNTSPTGSMKTNEPNNFTNNGGSGGYSITADPTTTAAVTILVTTTMAMTARVSYTFGWYWTKYGGNPRNIVTDLIVNSTAVSGSHMDTDDNVPDYTTIGRTAVYQASTTGTMSVGFRFVLPANSSTVTDDISVFNLRVVSCS